MTRTGDSEWRDRGLQRERTDLAWRRTALSAATCAVLLLHAAAREGWGAHLVPGVLVLVVAAVAALAGGRVRRGRILFVISVLVVLSCLWAVAFIG
ncbi:DUF202 domain-containing protein [Umezawaea sp. Da 62-37]|uniref:DUF202 domain-containing protein n=1 Tax=Umezawaea sp. Da 62-37 TaxID=3075927 RepID=UPI0028F727DF|nr:DUF202 domain-containing protein [Umezawaea sp. Da 62-37]WNV85181.1 DUF202 domain-containing protein [Umezawaea sp. Da 62-37]